MLPHSKQPSTRPVAEKVNQMVSNRVRVPPSSSDQSSPEVVAPQCSRVNNSEVVAPQPSLTEIDRVIGRQQALRKLRPRYYFCLDNNLCPSSTADEDKCRRLYERGPDISLRSQKSCAPRDLVIADDLLFPLGGNRFDFSMPTCAWLDEPFEHVKRDTCRRKKRKKVGVDHLKKSVLRKVAPRKSGCGVSGGAAKQRLHAAYSKVCTDSPIRNATEAPRAKSTKDNSDNRQQVGDDLEDRPLGAAAMRLLMSEESVWRPWVERPTAILLSVCDTVMQAAISRGSDISALQRPFIEGHYVAASYIYSCMRTRQSLNLLSDYKSQWVRNILFSLSNIIVSFDIPEDIVNSILRVHRGLDAAFANIEVTLGKSLNADIVHDPGSWLSAILPSFSNRRCRAAASPGFIAMLFPYARVNVFNVVPFQDFVPTGVPPHWNQGGVQNLIFRACLWCSTDFSVQPYRMNIPASIQAMRDHPALVAICVSRAIRHVMDEQGGIMANIDIGKFVEENVYHRRFEYKTILENLLQQDIPYWPSIEPVLSSLCVGWAIFNSLSSASTSVRVATALGVVVHSYIQHSLASRCFCEMLHNAKSLLYKGLKKLVAVFEAIWRSSDASDRQQMNMTDPLDWFTKVCACMDKEFTSKLLQAFAFIGAVVTCPWKNLGEAQIGDWAKKAFSFITDQASASMRKLAFIEQLFELVKFFFLRANLAWQYKDFSLFLYGRDEFNDLISKVNTLVSATAMLPYMSTTWSDAVVEGVPYNIETYRSLMAEIGVLSKQISKDLTSKKIKSLPVVVAAAMSRYATCVSTYEAFGKNQRNRPLPYVLFMVGPPSVGKNTLLEEVIAKVFKVCDFPKAIYELRDGVPVMTKYEMKRVDPCTWTSNAFDEYASGYTNMHNVVSFIEPTLASACTADGVKHSFSQIASFFSFVDTAPYSPVMASVDDKGKMTSNGILFATVSANDDSVNRWMLTCQMALLRRIGRMLVCLPYVSFKDDVTQGLDRNKIRSTEFKTDDDMWYFIVKKPKGNGTWNEGETSSTADWVIDLDAGDAGYIFTQHDLMDWLVGRVKTHFREQMAVMQKSENVKHASCCELDFRSGHDKDDHCAVCNSLLCGRKNDDQNKCFSRIVDIDRDALVCNLCNEIGKPGCICCDEVEQVSLAIGFGENAGRIISSKDSLKEVTGYCMISHCRKCYRSVQTPICGHYTCYSCGTKNQHSLRRAFIHGLSKTYDVLSLGDDEIEKAVCDAEGAKWCGNDYAPAVYKQGHRQQVKSEVICALAGGVALGAAVTYGLTRRRFRFVVEHEIHSPALDAVGNLSQGISRVFNLPNSPGMAYPEALPEISESSWFTWATDSVDAFSRFLKGFTVEQWVKFAGLIALLSGIYTLAHRSTAVTSVGSSKIRTTIRDICEAVRNARNTSCDQQMGLFDSNFIVKLLNEHGLTTGARVSKKSEVKIDNPWLTQSSLQTRVNFGKRLGHVGPNNCAQAVARIEKSLFVFACVQDAPVSDGRSDYMKGARIHALLLADNIFIVNTHFWMHAFVSQVEYKLTDRPRDEVDKTLSDLLDISDWDEFRNQVELLGVNTVRLIYDRVYDTAASGGKSGDGISAHGSELVSFCQIAGCISTDISVVKLTRVARVEKGGLVYNLRDLARGLLIPREHTAPTDAVLFPSPTRGEDVVFCDNIGSAIFSPKITFNCSIRGHERMYDTESWTIRLTKPTRDGDCGLPLIGVHHTKFISENGVSRIDPSGDTVAVLGIHRIYSSGRQTAHCAPLSIDMISVLLEKLDMTDQQLDGNCLYKIRSFSSGVVPDACYKVDFNRDICALSMSDSFTRTPIVFKSGSQNVFHDKSPLQWMGKGCTLPYAPDLGEAVALHGEAVGSVSGFRQGQFKSSVTRLPTANFFEFEQKHCAPDLNNRYGKEMNLVAMAGAHNGDLDVGLLRHIGSHMVRDTISDLDLLSSSWRETVHPLTDVETIVGSSDANFTPGINRSTGMGFPFYGPKNQYVRIDRDKSSHIESVCVQDEVLNEVKGMVDAYSRFDRANPVFTATPKDERLGESKIVPIYDVNGTIKCYGHNLRIFLCGSYPFVHLQRQQYLSVIRLVCDFPEVFEMAVGTNVASPRWGCMKDWLTWGGAADDFILAGDYSKFDKRMTCTWITVAFEVLLSIMRESGNYSDGDLRIAEGIAVDTASPLIDWFGDWFFVTNGHPSGHALTTIINGIVNRLYLRYAYYKLWSAWKGESAMSCDGYRSSVHTYVYGDDNISGVNGEARVFFTMPKICGVLKQVGVILTTEDKSEVINDFTNIRVASFLKRTWVCHNSAENSIWCAPLARKSLEAMVTVGVLNSKDVSAQMYSILRSFCDEYFHYGREEFDKVREKVLAICIDREYWVREGFPIVGVALLQQIEERGHGVFPTYDDLISRWEKSAWVPMRNV